MLFALLLAGLCVGFGRGLRKAKLCHTDNRQRTFREPPRILEPRLNGRVAEDCAGADPNVEDRDRRTIAGNFRSANGRKMDSSPPFTRASRPSGGRSRPNYPCGKAVDPSGSWRGKRGSSPATGFLFEIPQVSEIHCVFGQMWPKLVRQPMGSRMQTLSAKDAKYGFGRLIDFSPE